MPRPTGLFRPQQHANRIFVNRTEPIELFEKRLAAIDATSSELLVFYGVGGQGKTTLCRELLRRMTERGTKVFKTAHLDLQGRKTLDPRLALLWIRNALAGSGGLSFPAFDLGFLLYWHLISPEQPAPAFEGAAWLGQGEQFAAEGLSEGATAAAKMLVEHGIEGVPFVGQVLKKLAGWAIKAARKTFTLKTNEAVRSLFGPDGEPLHFTDIEKQLASLLAADLEHALAKNGGLRFVVLIDEYERAIESGGLTSRVRANAFDEQVARFAARAPAVLMTIFSRERLPWSHQPPAGADASSWRTWVDSAHHLLGGLSVRDADHFLAAVPIADPEVRAAMIDGATVGALSPDSVVYPLMLDLQLDIYLTNLVDGRLAIPSSEFRTAAASFGELRRQLLARLLRDYPHAEGALKRLAVPRAFDREVFLHLEKDFLTGFSLDQFDQMMDLSLVQQSADGELTLHRSVRESLLEMLGAKEQQETHRSLARFFEERAHPAPGAALEQRHVHALREAVYHRVELDARDAARWWLRFRTPYFDRPEVGSLIEIEQQLIDGLARSAPDELDLRLEITRLHAGELASSARLSEALASNTLAVDLARRMREPKLDVLLEVLLLQAALLQSANRLLEAEMFTDEITDAMTGVDESSLSGVAKNVLTIIAEGLALRGLHEKAELVMRTRVAMDRTLPTEAGDLDLAVAARLKLLAALLQQEKMAEAEAERTQLEKAVGESALSPTKKLLAYGTVARLYAGAGLSETAAEVAARAMAAWKEAAPPGDVIERSNFLHVKANLHSLLGETEAGMREATAWLRLIEESPAHGESDLLAPLFAVMRCANEGGDVALCESTLNRIEEIGERSGGIAPAQRFELLQIRMYLSQAKADGSADGRLIPLETAALLGEINRLGGTQFVLDLLQREEKSVRERLGANHPWRGEVLARLAEQYLGCMEPTKGLEAAETALPIVVADLGERHPFIAAIVSVILKCHSILGHPEETERWADRLEKLLATADPPMSLAVETASYVSLAERHLAQERWNEASKTYQVARRRAESRLSSSSPDVIQALDMMVAITDALAGGDCDARWEGLASFALSKLGPAHTVSAAAQQFLCTFLRDSKQYQRLAGAEVVRASILHGLFGSDDLRSRQAFVETAEAWRDAGHYADAEKWSSKALRAFTPGAETRDWWAESVCLAAALKLRRGRLQAASADADAVCADAAEHGPAGDGSLVDATVLRARLALIAGDSGAARSIAGELEALAATMTPGDALSRLWRRLTLIFTLLGSHDDVMRVGAEARRLAREVWPDFKWLEAEIDLLQSVSASAAGVPLPPGVTVWRLSEWLGTIRESSLPNDPGLAEHLVRAAAAVERMGEPELAVSMLRQGIDIIVNVCGEFHPDLRGAQRSLERLLGA